MPRIFGVDIPKNKRIEFALTYIYGIGPAVSKKILKEVDLDPDIRAGKLTDDEIHRITETIRVTGIKVEGDARREVMQNIKRMISINCYRGSRHKRGLPARGQKTHSNARTRKGPRRK